MTAHGFATGDGPYRLATTGTLPAATPTTLDSSTSYWVIRSDADNFKLATSRANAIALTAIDITTQGTGTHTIGGNRITSNIGVSIADLNAGLNNYGIDSPITAGTNKYFLHHTGDAQSVLGGPLSIGGAQTSLPGTTNAIGWSPAFGTVSGTGSAVGYSQTPTATMTGSNSMTGMIIGGVYGWQAPSPNVQFLTGIDWTAATTASVSVPAAEVVVGMKLRPSFNSGVANGYDVLQSSMIAATPTYAVANNNAGTTSVLYGEQQVPIMTTANNAASQWAVTSYTNYRGGATLTRGAASPNLSVGDFRQFSAENITATGSPTITRQIGFHADALTSGASNFQYEAVEMSASAVGTVGSNRGVWGVLADNNPNRFFYKNENGHVWQMGYASQPFTCTGLTPAVGDPTQYCQPVGKAAADTNENNVKVVVPGNVHAFAMSCGLSAAPGVASIRTFTLRVSNADTAMACTMIGNAQFRCASRVETGIAINVTATWDISEDVTTADAGGTDSASCVLYYNIDEF